MSKPTTDSSPTETGFLTCRGLRLARFSVGYLTYEGIRFLLEGETPEFSPVSIIVLVASLIVFALTGATLGALHPAGPPCTSTHR